MAQAAIRSAGRQAEAVVLRYCRCLPMGGKGLPLFSGRATGRLLGVAVGELAQVLLILMPKGLAWAV
ncbi:hypothetical protein DNJ95_02105 [Stutzerimonas kirkiae]|uniref:Uncharacterized protein n=1 Tax=Stutzerimonas kirkiae TaxID=2211392 RepID=A0A4V2KDJ6_9GAMM|nr:hypothetical protein DNJ96_01435 [Stutzerimonas kirkiae]TBV05685.1 hypothetical protein DNJ95_02105 [Stutzerimonas kirkiae]